MTLLKVCLLIASYQCCGSGSGLILVNWSDSVLSVPVGLDPNPVLLESRIRILFWTNFYRFFSINFCSKIKLQEEYFKTLRFVFFNCRIRIRSISVPDQHLCLLRTLGRKTHILHNYVNNMREIGKIQHEDVLCFLWWGERGTCFFPHPTIFFSWRGEGG